MLLTIEELGQKITRNSVFDYHLLPVSQQMAIKNSVSIYFLTMFVDIVNVFDCCLSGVVHKFRSEGVKKFKLIFLFTHHRCCRQGCRYPFHSDGFFHTYP